MRVCTEAYLLIVATHERNSTNEALNKNPITSLFSCVHPGSICPILQSSGRRCDWHA